MGATRTIACSLAGCCGCRSIVASQSPANVFSAFAELRSSAQAALTGDASAAAPAFGAASGAAVHGTGGATMPRINARTTAARMPLAYTAFILLAITTAAAPRRQFPFALKGRSHVS